MSGGISLRLRIFLFFCLLALGSAAIVSVALWFSYRRLGDPAALPAFFNAGLIAGFGVVGLTAFVWLLFDENIAKAIERLAAGLRARAHTDIRGEIDAQPARYLGDLAPAAAAVSERLSEAKYLAAEDIARKTSQLEAEKAQLSAILSEIPVAVLMICPKHRVTLYDGQCAATIGGETPLCLGRSICDYVDERAFHAALEELESRPDVRSVDAKLPSTEGQRLFCANIRRLSGDRGYVLAIEMAGEPRTERPMVFDFDLIDRAVSDDIGATNLADLTFVVFDTETTGLSTDTDEIVQIGALRIVNGRQVAGEVFETLVDPGRAIPQRSTEVHGVTEEMVRGAPDIVTAGRRFHGFASGAVLVAHNAPFDLAFFRRHEQRIGRSFDFPVLDTVLLSAAIFGESATHTLDALTEALDAPVDPGLRHTALGDAEMTADVFTRMIPILASKGVHTFGDAVAAMRRHQRLLADMNAT